MIKKNIKLILILYLIIFFFYPLFMYNWGWVYRRISLHGPSVTTDIARLDYFQGNVNSLCEFLISEILEKTKPNLIIYFPDKKKINLFI